MINDTSFAFINIHTWNTRPSLKLRLFVLVHRGALKLQPPTWRNVKHHILRPQKPSGSSLPSIRTCREALLRFHGVFEAPHLQQSDLEALGAQRRVVKGQAAFGSAVVQLRIDVESVTVPSTFINNRQIARYRNSSRLEVKKNKRCINRKNCESWSDWPIMMESTFPAINMEVFREFRLKWRADRKGERWDGSVAGFSRFSGELLPAWSSVAGWAALASSGCLIMTHS